MKAHRPILEPGSWPDLTACFAERALIAVGRPIANPLSPVDTLLLEQIERSLRLDAFDDCRAFESVGEVHDRLTR